MVWRGLVITFFAGLALASAGARAQSQPPSEQAVLNGTSATTWAEAGGNVVLLHGPVHITFDRAKLSADNAVVWLAPASRENLDVQNASIALIGHAVLEHGDATRSGGNLFVSAQVRGQGIRIVADERSAKNESKSDLFEQAAALRKAEQPRSTTVSAGPSAMKAGGPTSAPARPQRTSAGLPVGETPIDFEAKNLQSVQTDEGNVALVLTGDVRLIERRPTGDYVELSADTVVLFTNLKSLREAAQTSNGRKRGQDIMQAAYLEGDVRIDYNSAKHGVPEQRLTANRCYYEFASDRAVLTDAIVHTIEPQHGTAIILRAKTVRQLATGEFLTQNARLSNSSFAVPSYSLAAEKIYVKSEPSGDPRVGDSVYFDAKNIQLQAFDIPFFWLPAASGDMSKGLPLRGLGGGNSHDFGPFVKTLWGLFETFGAEPPRDLDVNYRLDYLGKRGPGAGLNAEYGGGFLTDTTKQAWDFEGEFKSYFVYDHGQDDLGRAYERINDPSTLRGQVIWEHQHIFPDNWQAQLRAGYVTDATFMEQWFRDDFQDGDPHDLMGYIKHQTDSEALTFGATWQPSKLVTTSGQQQEQFEVNRIPEIGYYREGDSLLDDRLTLFSENTGVGLQYSRSRADLVSQGFSLTNPALQPGLASEGYTGLTNQVVWRGDFREELDFPFSLGPARVVPYVMGRFTQYSNSPGIGQEARAMVASGLRVSTEIWKVDPSFDNNLLDLHQLRHVIVPEINLFTSAMNAHRNDVFVYDPSVDAINDISAAEFSLRQRWETKRGGPGQWRSVDAFSLGISVNVFEHKPPTKLFNQPYGFRGLFFDTYPEESIPRNSVNVDASWRLSDNTVVLGDIAENLDKGRVATMSVGVLVRRDTRLSYYIGNHYIADLRSNITMFHADYEFTPKYLIDIDQQFDFTVGKDVQTSMSIARRFDTFMLAFRYYYDEITRENGFSFNFYPLGLGQGLDTNAFSTFKR